MMRTFPKPIFLFLCIFLSTCQHRVALCTTSTEGLFTQITTTGEAWQRLRVETIPLRSEHCFECTMVCVERKQDSPRCLGYMCNPLDKTCHIYVEDNTKPPSVGVELSWLQISGTFYTLTFGEKKISIYYSSKRTSWARAKSHCARLGGYLSDLDCVEDYDAIRFVTRENPEENVFVGGTDEVEEGKWVTVKDGTPIDEEVWRWSDGEPSNHGGYEDVAMLFLKTMKCNDVGSWYKRHYICERDVE